MAWQETLRVALEASVVVQVALLAAFLIARADWRKPTGFFLIAICAHLAVACIVNALAASGVAAPVRVANYFVELALWPLLLGLATRAGQTDAPLRRADLGFIAIPLLGAGALLAGWRHAPDGLMLALAWISLMFAALQLMRREQDLRAARQLNLIRGVVLVMLAAVTMRTWVSIDGEFGLHYRESVAYIGMLAVGFAFAAHLLWLALRQPTAFAPAPSAPAPVPELESAFTRLIEDERLYLNAELSLADVARRLNTSPRIVSRLVATRHGQNLCAYLNTRRAEFAADALRMSDDPITTIMYDAGFGSKSAFQREFARRYGMSPTEYRRRLAQT